jgi:GR25 family glycosyltransferase involved in LPS biosynthesis
MRTFVINLDSHPDRWEKFRNTEYIRHRATPRQEVPGFMDKKVVSRHNTRREFHLGKCGCLTSHLSVLIHIVDSRYESPSLILEDDAVIDATCSPLLDSYPRDHFIYLAGFFHNKLMSSNEVPSGIPRVKGLNKIDKNLFRIICLQAYVIPNWEVADKILNHYKSLSRWRAADIMITDVSVPMLYQYPACFIEDSVESSINKKTKFSDASYGRKQK